MIHHVLFDTIVMLTSILEWSGVPITKAAIFLIFMIETDNHILWRLDGINDKWMHHETHPLKSLFVMWCLLLELYWKQNSILSQMPNDSMGIETYCSRTHMRHSYFGLIHCQTVFGTFNDLVAHNRTYTFLMILRLSVYTNLLNRDCFYRKYRNWAQCRFEATHRLLRFRPYRALRYKWS